MNKNLVAKVSKDYFTFFADVVGEGVELFQGDPTKLLIFKSLLACCLFSLTPDEFLVDIPIEKRVRVSAHSLAQVCRLPRTTVLRHLAQMRKEGVVTQYTDGWTVGGVGPDRVQDLYATLMPKLLRFAQKTY